MAGQSMARQVSGQAIQMAANGSALRLDLCGTRHESKHTVEFNGKQNRYGVVPPPAIAIADGEHEPSGGLACTRQAPVRVAMDVAVTIYPRSFESSIGRSAI
jgi:hypothetical protein